MQVVALLVASHYKNTPNDLLLLADAPAHQLYVLLGPVDETQNALPDVLAVVQVGPRSMLFRHQEVVFAHPRDIRDCSWCFPTCCLYASERLCRTVSTAVAASRAQLSNSFIVCAPGCMGSVRPVT